MKSILILGSNGFSGKHLQKFLFDFNIYEKYLIYCVDIHNIEYYQKFEYITLDVSKKREFRSLIMRLKPNIIINLIGSFNSNNFELLYKINCKITQNLLSFCAKLKKKPDKILLIGSAAEYGNPKHLPIKENHPLNPINYYGLTKMFQTKIGKFFHRNHNLNINFARTFNIMGPGISNKLAFGSFLSKIKCISKEGTIKVGNLSSKRDFLDILDVINAYWLIVEKGKSGEIYNVCSSISYKVGDLLNSLIKLSEKTINIEVNSDLIKKHDISNIYGDNTKLINQTGWHSELTILESLRNMLNYKLDDF